MQIGDGVLRMRRGGEDEAFLVLEDLQPAGTVWPGFEFQHDAQIGGEETVAKVCDRFLRACATHRPYDNVRDRD